MRNYPDIGLQTGEILLPAPEINPQKWAVIACDQFTSQPEYWNKVEKVVGGAPSTLDMILPEVYLNTPVESQKVLSTQQAMRRYLDENKLVSHTGLIFVEREVDGKTRRGVMAMLDLEQYDFHQGSQSLIRATEGTIIERLPPRIRIREGALLEIPHILVLIDDPERTVIEPLIDIKSSLEPLYDFELMLGSGHLRGFHITASGQEERIVHALCKLADPQRFQQTYHVGSDKGVLLFALGDGNHSLATAKSLWDKIRHTARPDHPARYALVEIENVHDTGLVFEPIHRVVFGVKADWKQAIQEFFKGDIEFTPVSGIAEIQSMLKTASSDCQHVGVITQAGFELASFTKPLSNLAVGSLQAFLDRWIKTGNAEYIDYVHGEEVVLRLGAQTNNLGFYLPRMDKGDLFRTVILDGALPRKTFSMGDAHEKRFYFESRRIA